MRNCPYCAESIKDEAIRCPHCRKNLKRSGPLLGILVALVVAGILAVFLFVMLEPANQERSRPVSRSVAVKPAVKSGEHPPAPATQPVANATLPSQTEPAAEKKDGEANAAKRDGSETERLLAPVVRLENFALRGTGSGFLVSGDGYILTAAHVVEGASSIEVQLGKQKLSASVVAVETEGDVALLKIYKRDGDPAFPFLPLGDAMQLRVAAPVTVLGYPLGFKAPSVTKGIVSAVPVYLEGISFPLIQMDAAINPGNSGGPVVDEQGEVVGIVSGKIGPAESINFATPVNAVSRLPLPAAASLDGNGYRTWRETASDKAFMARASAPEVAAVKIEGAYLSGETLMLAFSLRSAAGKPVRTQGNVTATVDFTTLKAGFGDVSDREPCERSIRFKERDYRSKNGVPIVYIPLDCKIMDNSSILSVTIRVRGDHIPKGDSIHYP